MKITEEIREFWNKFCRSNPEINTDAPFQIWFFGNTHALARELGELVMSGKKIATASLVSINEMKPEFAPIPDGYSVVTDFDGNPLCVIQTTEIRHLPFDEVDAQFAFDEGEGDQTLGSWREGHWRYFTKEAGESAVEFDEKSLICCERFKKLFPKL
jgi:uncharacterized protein YhfF